jgi:hypothetical protein
MVGANRTLVLLCLGIVLTGTTLLGTMQILAQVNDRAGIVTGRVTIGPFCPVEPATGCPARPHTYSSRELVLKSSGGNRVFVPLSDGGTFSASVKSGIYTVTLTNCNFLGCSHDMPKNIALNAGNSTTVDIFIDTGIR